MYKFLKKKNFRVIGSAAVALVVLFFYVPSVFSGIKNLSVTVFLFPVKLYSKSTWYFQSKKKLIRENEILSKKTVDLELKLERFKELADENMRLRRLLKFKEKIGFDTVSAEVVVRDPNKWMGSFIIDKGIDDGVLKNSAVCSSKGLLGKVAEAKDNVSRVMLITHPNFKAGGILKRERLNGIIVGLGTGTVKMLYLPPDAKIKKGDVVTTSEFSRIFPKGVGIGRVMSSGISKTGLYRYALIRPFANPFDQEEVLCIK